MKKSKKNSSTDSKKYVFVEANSKDFTAIKLTKGKWKDVICVCFHTILPVLFMSSSLVMLHTTENAHMYVGYINRVCVC